MRTSRLALLLAVLVLVGLGTFWLLTEPTKITAAALPSRTPDLANGETMFNIGGCVSCHQTPDQQDRKRLGGGLALKTPFGTFKVPNISQHPERGIGQWSEADFVTAMLKGVGRQGEHLYPAFPYTSYQRMKLEDVRDLFVFMKTLPQDDKVSEPHELSFPFNIRRGLGLWKLVNLDGNTFAPDPARSAELNRGAYLVEGPGHCAECHSPRNFMGAIRPDRRFAGGRDPSGEGDFPNISQDPEHGIGKWTQAQIVELLTTGYTPSDKVQSPMLEVTENTALLSDADRNAMAAYLKSLPAR
jgi:mono/diheme cytochrome c family protein